MPPRIGKRNREKKKKERRRKTVFRFTICSVDQCTTPWSFKPHLTAVTPIVSVTNSIANSTALA